MRLIFGRYNRPAESVIRATMERFCTKFTLVDNAHPQRCRTVRAEGAIAAVEQRIEDDPIESNRYRAQQLELCLSTLWKILRKDLGLWAYKIQLVQELKPNDLPQGRIFWCSGLLESWPKIHFFIEKLCSAAKLIFGSIHT